MSVPEVVHLELPEPPSANRWWRKFRNRMVLSADARAYKHAVWMLTGRYRTSEPDAFLHPLFQQEPIRISVTWLRSRRSGDLDKRLGVLLDALEETVYTNDRQIVELHAFRVDAGADGGKVHVDVSVAA